MWCIGVPWNARASTWAKWRWACSTAFLASQASPATASSRTPNAGGLWVTTGSPVVGGYDQAATLLRTGDVLVAGQFTVTNNAELYHPSTGMFTLTGPMERARLGGRAVLLRNGRVLVTGGYDDNGDPVSSANLYDASLAQWIATGRMHAARNGHVALLLPDG